MTRQQHQFQYTLLSEQEVLNHPPPLTGNMRRRSPSLHTRSSKESKDFPKLAKTRTKNRTLLDNLAGQCDPTVPT